MSAKIQKLVKGGENRQENVVKRGLKGAKWQKRWENENKIGNNWLKLAKQVCTGKIERQKCVEVENGWKKNVKMWQKWVKCMLNWFLKSGK